MNKPQRFHPADRMAALPPYFFHKLNEKIARLITAGVDVIRMDMGSPDLPPAPFVVQALKRSAEDPTHHGYMPTVGTLAYREAWAHFYGARFGVELDAQKEIVGLLGSKDGVFHLALAIVNPGDVALVPDPGYAPYTTGARLAGGEVIYMPLLAENRFLPDLRRLTPDILRRTKLMWLNYPNNPTGAVAPPEFFGQVVQLAQAHGFLVAHDAPYTEITYDAYRAPSILQIPGAKDVCVEFNTLSKTYNMGGWRVGVACGNVEVVQALSALKSNIDSGFFQPVLDAAIAALTGEQAWLIERNETYRERRDIVVAALRQAGMQVNPPPAAIYVWARLPDRMMDESPEAQRSGDEAYAEQLLEETGVSVTPGAVFGPSGRGYIRISLGTPTARVKEAMARVARWRGEQ